MIKQIEEYRGTGLNVQGVSEKDEIVVVAP